MTNQDRENRRKFIEVVCKDSELSGLTYSVREGLARLLLRHAKTHGRLQEANCNGVGTWHNEDPKSFARRQDRFEKQIEKKETQIEKRITEIAMALGFTVEFGGDPRGYTVKLTLPSGAYNSWGGKECGYGVPTVE